MDTSESPKILTESLLNDLKRKQLLLNNEAISGVKKARIEPKLASNFVAISANGGGRLTPVNSQGVKTTDEKVIAIAQVAPSIPAADPIDLSKINKEMEVETTHEDKIVTPEDIRKLKEMLRQEEAKLQLIKR